jgi:hypothetical protein
MTKVSTALDQVENWTSGSLVTSYVGFITTTTIVAIMTM